MTRARRIATAWTYKRYERLIASLAFQFIRSYGPAVGNHEELVSIGGELFMEAYNRYDPERGSSFRNWLCTWIWRRWIEQLRKEIWRSRPNGDYKTTCVNYVDMTECEYGSDVSQFHLTEFLETISEDARTIVELVLDTHEELRRVMLSDDPNPSGRSARKGLRQYLDGLGWENGRISDTFREITEALYDV